MSLSLLIFVASQGIPPESPAPFTTDTGIAAPGQYGRSAISKTQVEKSKLPCVIVFYQCHCSTPSASFMRHAMSAPSDFSSLIQAVATPNVLFIHQNHVTTNDSDPKLPCVIKFYQCQCSTPSASFMRHAMSAPSDFSSLIQAVETPNVLFIHQNHVQTNDSDFMRHELKFNHSQMCTISAFAMHHVSSAYSVACLLMQDMETKLSSSVFSANPLMESFNTLILMQGEACEIQVDQNRRDTCNFSSCSAPVCLLPSKVPQCVPQYMSFIINLFDTENNVHFLGGTKQQPRGIQGMRGPLALQRQHRNEATISSHLSKVPIDLREEIKKCLFHQCDSCGLAHSFGSVTCANSFNMMTDKIHVPRCENCSSQWTQWYMGDRGREIKINCDCWGEGSYKSISARHQIELFEQNPPEPYQITKC